MEKYVRITFRMERDREVIGKAETHLGGRELEDGLFVSDEWMREFFGRDESDLWEISDVEEITKEEALNCEREVDIDVFAVEATEDVEG